MSKTLRTVAVIAGAVALVAATGGAALGALAPAGLAGTATVAGVSAATLSTIATVASVASTLATIGAQMTAKKPPNRGTINQVIIAAEPPSPYIIGRTYSGGVLRHDVGYGATLKKVPNPYRGMVMVYSVAGPLMGLEACYMDYAAIPFTGGAATGYYSSFLYRDVRNGLLSETALTPHWSGMPNWTASHKLSGKAAILWNGLFDKDGKRFASGWPSSGAVWQGVMSYDARQDSTYPGGSGAHRINDETTWTYSECPGRHALAYVLGRFRNGKKVFGVGLPPDGIIVQDFVTLSNICDANGWKVGGVIYEPGDRWANLKRILEAGAAEPMWRGGKLGLRFNAPRLSLGSISANDLADPDVDVTAMQSWGVRLNGIRPKYRSEANKWEYVQSALVSISSYLTEDGEEKVEEQQYDLVQQKDQAAQLAAYRLLNGRELAPIVIPCKPHMRHYGPGDMLTLQLPEHGLGGINAIILKRNLDPASMVVTFTMMSESAGKHDFALGRTGTAPPTPALTTGQDRDDIATEVVKGNDGDPGYSVAPPAWALSVNCTSNGTIKTGQLPQTATMYVYQGATPISEDPSVAYAITGQVNATASLSGANNRLLTINSLAADDGQIVVTITRSGAQIGQVIVRLTKVKDGSAVATSTDDTITINNSASYAGVQGGPLTLGVGPGGTITMNANVNYNATSGSAGLAGKWQYRTTPGSGAWTDVATEVQDSLGATAGEPGNLAVSASMSGPAGAENWEFQLLLRKFSGAGTLAIGAGSNASVYRT